MWASRWPAQPRKRTAWTPDDLIFIILTAPGEIEVRPGKDFLLRDQTMASLRSPGGGATSQPTGRVLRGHGGGAREGLVGQGVRAAGRAAGRARPTWSEATHPRPPQHGKGSGIAFRLQRRASPLMSVLQGASFQLRAPGKGVAVPEVTQLPQGRG